MMPAAESATVTRPPPPAVPVVDLLVRQAQQGDKRAFEQLYRKNVERVLALTTRLVGGDAAHGEDLAQQTFVKAWRALPGFRAQAAFSTWLHRIAVRLACDHHRSAWQRHRGLATAEASAPADPGPGLDLERAIAALPTRARQVFVLHDVEGWRHLDIAEVLEISVGTSKSQLSRARSLLRQGLDR